MAQPAAPTFRILSLDGGGPWSLIQARTLGRIFDPDMPGLDLLSAFDLVAGNSGGAVVVAGLLANMSPRLIESGYFTNQQRLHAIFKRSTPLSNPVTLPLRAAGVDVYQYQTPAKLVALRDALGAVGDRKLPELGALFAGRARTPRFVFTAFGYDRLREVHFRSDPASPAAPVSTDAPLTLAEAVHASSTAPILYFDAPATIGAGVARQRFWDGAAGGYDNPVLLATAEAIAYRVRRERTRVISLGTGNLLQPLASQFPDADRDLVRATPDYTIVRDVGKIASAVLDDPPDAASLHAYIALGRSLPARLGNSVWPQTTPGFVRMNPLIRPHFANGAWAAPASFRGDAWRTLRDLGLVAIEPEQIAVIQRLSDAWMRSDPFDIPNQPIRLSWPSFACELGYATFADALEAARAIVSAGV